MKKQRTPKLGQHFLTRDAVPRLMAETAELNSSDTVLEVGPGTGILTRVLLASGARVIAVEKDSRWTTALAESMGHPANLTVVNNDFRDWWLSASRQSILGDKYKIVANIPYYLTGELFRQWLSANQLPTTIVCLTQKEVAERIVGAKRESLLSLSIKAYGQPKIIRAVKRTHFSPPPKVDSAILAINHISRQHLPNPIIEKRFFDLLRVSFASPRKMLGGKLPALVERFAACQISPRARAETLKLEQWLCLARL